MGEEETTYIDLTPTNEAMATMLYQVATESTNAKDRAWARSNLIRGYANANWDTNQSESTKAAFEDLKEITVVIQDD